MDQAIHGVNKDIKSFTLSNYSLTTQIVIINLFTAFIAFIFLIIFNLILWSSNKNLETHKQSVYSQLNEITNYLSINAIKRILTFDESCIMVEGSKNREEVRTRCEKNNLLDKNYGDKPLKLDPTYTQKYIYSNFSNSLLTVKVFSDDWTKFADTGDFYVAEEEVIILDINERNILNSTEKESFFKKYKQTYLYLYNSIQKYFDESKLKKLKNDNVIVMESIKTKKATSYMFKDEDKQFKSVIGSPILKDGKVFGVVLIIAPLTYDNNESSLQSLLLTNFFFFFISIMFFLSLLFSKSIVTPLKALSQITKLERDKSTTKKFQITYPNRKDEIGNLSFDIKSMSEDLKKRIVEIEEFAADVSHELKNPLSSLKSSSELLKIKKIEEKNKDILIKNMIYDIDRMNILISDISNYTLTQVEISEEVLENIEINKFVNDLQNSISSKNYSLLVESNKKNIIVKINKNKFLQVIHNLLDNASSYIKIGSKILININVSSDYCIIDFVDQGEGIPLEYKDKIFERFYTDRKQTRKTHSGLGLSISKNIIESFGGTINLVKSTHPGFEGACFEIKLPLKETSKNH